MYKYYQVDWFIHHLWEYILCTSINIRKTMDNPRLWSMWRFRIIKDMELKKPRRRASTHSLRAASLLLSGSSCTWKCFILISLKMSFSHRRSCGLSKSSGRNSNWGKLPSHLKTILLCNLLDQVVHLEKRDLSIEDLVWLWPHLAGGSGCSCGSCHGPFHHTCVNIQVFEGLLKLIHHL